MKRRPRSEEEPELFDLPLSDEPLPMTPPVPPAPPRPKAPPPVQPTESASWLDEIPERDADDDPADVVAAAVTTPTQPRNAAPLPRLVAGLMDLTVLLAVGLAVWAGLRWLGIQPSADDWPAALTFHLTFSFLYFVLPLAFWGRTPGMARTGLATRNTNGDHLSFGQAIARWLGALLTGALAGIPLLLSFTGRSLSDRLSGSETVTG